MLQLHINIVIFLFLVVITGKEEEAYRRLISGITMF